MLEAIIFGINEVVMLLTGMFIGYNIRNKANKI